MGLLIDEADKCALLCANCHCLEHFLNEDATNIEFLNKAGYEVPIQIPDLSKTKNASKKLRNKEVVENHCVVCGTMLKRNKSHICQTCSHDRQRKVKNRPGKIQLA